MSSSRVRTARLPETDGTSAPVRPEDRQPATAGRPSAPPLDGPLVLDRYRLYRRLGAGAFGTVWMARDERLQRDVAVKILARERILGGRFEREARAAARLSHPGIVTLYEAAVDDEGAYLVSELVRGATLDALLTAGQLSDQDIVAIGIALCDAVGHAHGQGVVHRDVKPSNVLVPEAPGSAAQVAKLTDFGVARVIDSDALTATGDVLGTLAYMAPEQAEGLEADAPADLYSLALVLYEALTGVNPVAAIPARARRLGAHLPPLRRQRRDLPPALGRAIDTALAPRARERGCVAELRDALDAARPQVGAEPGIVAGAWSRDPSTTEPEPFTARGVPERAAPDHAPRRTWPSRGAAAVGAAGFAAWIDARLLGTGGSVTPAAVALGAGCAVLLAPRLGWAVTTLALCVTAAIQGHGGGALVIALAALLPITTMPLRPAGWPLSAAAPALGMIGLAGAWPGVASRAQGPLQRAALGAIGWVWLLLAGAVSGRQLYLRHIPGLPARAAWIGSLHRTVEHLLSTYISTGVLAGAAVWAAGAAIAPWLVRGQMPTLDIFRVIVWAAVVLGGTSAAIAAVHGSDAVGAAPSAAPGAVASVLVTLLPLAWPRLRRAWQTTPLGARFP